MTGPVEDEPQIRAQRRAMRLDRRPQTGRAHLLLAVEEKLQIHRRGRARGHERRVSVEDRHHAGLVVRAAAPREPPRRINAVAGLPALDDLPALLDRARRKFRRKRLPARGPLRRVHRLTVVMRLEHHGPRRPGHLHLAEHGRIRIRRRHGEQPRLDPAALHHPDDEVGVAADVRTVDGHVGNREQLAILVDHFALMRHAPRADLVRQRRRLPRRPGDHQRPTHRRATEKLHRLPFAPPRAQAKTGKFFVRSPRPRA